MRIDLFTLFPALVSPWLDASLVGKARAAGILDLRVHDLRSATTDPHRSVDDSPFGGGAGMVLAPQPVFAAVEAADPPRPLLLLGAAGRRFDQGWAEELAVGGSLSLLCGRYEGVDQRVSDHLVDGELCLGDFVLAGGEVAALAVVEAVCRLVPGVMGNERSADEESFADGLLEYPHYTRPAVFRGWEVPAVLRSGDHGLVSRWRRAQALARTVERRPDLITRRGGLRDEEQTLLADLGPSSSGPASAPSDGSPPADSPRTDGSPLSAPPSPSSSAPLSSSPSSDGLPPSASSPASPGDPPSLSASPRSGPDDWRPRSASSLPLPDAPPDRDRPPAEHPVP